MKVVDKAIRKVYRFSCPNCGSKLEAECQELVDIGGKVCRKDRYIGWGDLRKKTVYEADNVTR